MRAGSLDRRIRIERRVETQSTSGHPVETWRSEATVWASVRYDKGSERFNAPQYTGKTMAVFRVRWSQLTAGLTSRHRLIFNDRVHDVMDLREIGRREAIEIDASVRNETPLDGGAT